MSANEEVIKTVLDGILGRAAQSNAETYQAVAANERVKRATEYAAEGQYEEFEKELLYPFDQVVDGLLAGVTDSSDAQFLIKHGDFVSIHFNKLIEKYEGMPIKFNYEQEYTYHLPTKIFMTHDEIVSFATGLHHLYYGRPEKYLEALQSVLTAAGGNNEGKDDV